MFFLMVSSMLRRIMPLMLHYFLSINDVLRWCEDLDYDRSLRRCIDLFM